MVMSGLVIGVSSLWPDHVCLIFGEGKSTTAGAAKLASSVIASSDRR
jgi:hypothetical protein